MISPLRTAPQRCARGSTRGFTLVELVAVVVIISIVAALAIPSITSRLRDRRTQQAAQTIAQLYTTARMRAMGRGAAVLVRYNAGLFEIREAVRGTVAESDPNCQPLPISSCTQPGQWAVQANAPNRLITSFEPAARSEYEGVQVQVRQASSTDTTTAMDVCFTPMGRTFVSYSVAGGLNPLAGIPEARVWREDSSGPVGLRRVVKIMPDGNSHLGTAE